MRQQRRLTPVRRQRRLAPVLRLRGLAVLGLLLRRAELVVAPAGLRGAVLVRGLVLLLRLAVLVLRLLLVRIGSRLLLLRRAPLVLGLLLWLRRPPLVLGRLLLRLPVLLLALLGLLPVLLLPVSLLPLAVLVLGLLLVRIGGRLLLLRRAPLVLGLLLWLRGPPLVLGLLLRCPPRVRGRLLLLLLPILLLPVLRLPMLGLAVLGRPAVLLAPLLRPRRRRYPLRVVSALALLRRAATGAREVGPAAHAEQVARLERFVTDRAFQGRHDTSPERTPARSSLDVRCSMSPLRGIPM
ncbi:hypothetical protein [Spirillospora sp. CA-128828]|uniref:hypothetical protein n=1 Tax=Spirillospora sp. CA-128828 TaxID=3240033 RepID=UPI003D93CDE5